MFIIPSQAIYILKNKKDINMTIVYFLSIIIPAVLAGFAYYKICVEWAEKLCEADTNKKTQRKEKRHET